VLTHYHALAGIPSLINTSPNIHEEPIVCTPSEAVKAFKAVRLDALAIGDHLALNGSPEARGRRETASAPA
jgi:carbamoyltransferase